ncbi:hypothetical protein HUJ05_001022 [Dendroctonus ponderosae]|nr:hypothetical protein HUJ05_001022 [Dendroctonus ponderosae]KAH1027535.1 hypothetical protein HUJ05_001022 [Dendroctonus ponderosae]KAH1027536.1 hypothetical protein HUJ05_001022 [Dendroctonus ponderosae]
MLKQSNEKMELANIWKRIEQMENKLDGRRADNRELHQQLTDFFAAGSSNVVTNYVDLKEKLHTTYREINTLEAKLIDLDMRVTAEREEFQLKNDQQSKAHEEPEMKHLKLKSEEIENRKNEHKRNGKCTCPEIKYQQLTIPFAAVSVEHLNNELQLVQATMDLEQDEMETQLRRELIDLKSKIWRQQNIAKEVQIKIDDLERRQQAVVRPQNMYAGAQELQFFQLNQLEDVFAADLDSSNAQQKSTKNVDNNEGNVQVHGKKPDLPCAEAQLSFETLKCNKNSAKFNQAQVNKWNNKNLKMPAHEAENQQTGSCLSESVLKRASQTINNEYKISSYSDVGTEIAAITQESLEIHRDINTRKNTMKEHIKSSCTNIIRSSKRIGSIKPSRPKCKKDDSQIIIPKWENKSNKTATGNVSSLPKRTSLKSHYNPLSAQKRSSKCSNETFANNPTMQTSEQDVPKKRKLFNINNLEYLEDLIPVNE